MQQKKLKNKNKNLWARGYKRILSREEKLFSTGARASVYCGVFLQFLWVQIQKFCRFRISLKKRAGKFLNEMDVNMDVIACTCTDSLGVRTWLFDDPFQLRCQIINLSNRELLIKLWNKGNRDLDSKSVVMFRNI